MPCLITGCAGFIGYHLSRRLLSEGHQVIGLDNLNDYYDVSLKNARLELLKPYENFSFIKASLEERQAIEQIFSKEYIPTVINLAAQAGVRYSITNPPYPANNIR